MGETPAWDSFNKVSGTFPVQYHPQNIQVYSTYSMARNCSSSRSSIEDPDIQDEQDHSSDLSGPEAPQNVVKTKLWDDEVEVLEEALEDWKAADSNQRKVMKNAMKAKIKQLPANSTLKGHKWEKKKKVCPISITSHGLLMHHQYQAIKNWLYNHS